MDLSDIKIQNANMDFSLCNHTTFENANLQNCSFIGAQFYDANFRNTNLNNLKLDNNVKTLIGHNDRITSVTLSKKGKYIASGSCNHNCFFI